MTSRFVNFGLFFIVLGLFALEEGMRLFFATRIPHGPGQYVAAIGGLILLTGVIYYIQEVKNLTKAKSGKMPKKTEDAPAQEEKLPKGVARCLSLSFKIAGREITISTEILAFAIFILYAIFSQLIGYFVSTALFVFAGMFLFGERVWWRLGLFSAISGVIFWYVFIKFADIPL